MLTGRPTRRSLQSHYSDIGVYIAENIGGGGRWSVEVPNGCLGICDTLLEAETICEDYRERVAEARRDETARKEMQEAFDRIPKPCRH